MKQHPTFYSNRWCLGWTLKEGWESARRTGWECVQAKGAGQQPERRTVSEKLDATVIKKIDEYMVGKACRPSLWGSFYALQGPWISFWMLQTVPQSILIRGMTVQMCLYKMRDRKQEASAVFPSVVVCDPTKSQVLIRVEKSHRQLWEWSHRRYGGWFEVLSLGEAMSWRGDREERPEPREVPFRTC